MDRAEFKAAAEAVVAATLVSNDWGQALERLARAAGARDAVLMRNSVSAMEAAIATESATDAVAQFSRGETPPNSRYQRVRADITTGFRFDLDDYAVDELSVDPFYQEFLRPCGLFWHANAVLLQETQDYVELSLKRTPDAGPFLPEDAAVLNAMLPDLRAAARIARMRLDSETRGMRWLLERRGNRVFEIDSHGCVLPGQEAAVGKLSVVSGRRLAAPDPVENRRLARAVAAATGSHARAAAVRISKPDDGYLLIQFIPVTEACRDVFGAAAALAILVDPDARAPAHPDPSRLFGEAYGLTERECAVADLIGAGLDLRAAAAQLDIGLETARTHLKNAFAKTGTRRQAELAARIAELHI